MLRHPRHAAKGSLSVGGWQIADRQRHPTGAAPPTPALPSLLAAASQRVRGPQVVGRHVTIALVDVYYDGSSACAACGLAESWEADSTLEEQVLRIGHVAPYEPGRFYRR